MDIRQLNEMSYPDFVGYINQWNVLPGSYVTLSKWATFSHMNANSRILQFACTTGFQSRELAVLTGCSGKAFDLSSQAIEMANYNLQHYAPNAQIDYFVADGTKLKLDEKFSHVIIGAGYQFFANPQEAIKKTVEFIEDGGYLLASPFYIKQPIPYELIEEFKTVFGISPTTLGYKDIMSMFNKLEIIYEDRNELCLETEDELQYYCRCTIDRACKIRNITDTALKQAMFDRLYKIKEMSNKLRPYQSYGVLVLRYRQSVYPKRFVELF
ncbi:MAG: class I SAM-dependent methyltransferase [Alphaproteobacteria bacterium]|nr:class I SAM-dependent methyltransferase [Alphaproteobacteria bacterium]